DGSLDKVDLSSPWGNVTTEQYLTNAFANSEEARKNQDVGLDGLDLQKETAKHNDFLNNLPVETRALVASDPSADDFKYFLGADHDDKNAKILERYKNYNGTENNSPLISNDAAYTASGSSLPDNEDLNDDNTLSELEEYYEYKVPLKPGQMKVGNKYIVDEVNYTHPGTGENVTWYLFRIPIRQYDNKYGNINGFKSIRYMRMYMTNFTEPVVLRLANFRLVGSKWRRYKGNLEEPRFGEPLEPDLDNFTVSVVSVEENGQGSATQSPYVLPPDFERDRDNTSAITRRLNEQSMQICIDNLEDTDARAVFKNINMDLINYGRLKMFLHADSEAEDDELTAFIRLGTDFNQNYYEIEVPLKVTTPGSSLSRDIWPLENEIDIDLDLLLSLKSARNRDQAPISELYPVNGPRVEGRHRLRLLGRPKLSEIRTIMIGVRNPASPDRKPYSVCIWANELRVTDFDRTAGWAANTTLNTKFADIGNVTASARHVTYGFGGIQSKIPERTREKTTSFDVSANVALDKLLPEKAGIQLPMYVSYEKTMVEPRFDPLDPDIRLSATLKSLPTEDQKNEYMRSVEDISERRSINFSNVRKVKTNPDAKSHFWDVENLSFTYAYSEMEQHDYKTAGYLRRDYRGSVTYNFAPQIKPWEPFADSEGLKSPYFKFIKEFNFNPLPNNIFIQGDVDRRFVRTQYRNEILNSGNQANYEKYFTFNRTYDVRWDITQNLSFDYNARANAIIDEPEGDIDTQEKADSIITNAKTLGRMKNFNQGAGITYKIPLGKFPLTDWLSADYKYQTGYSWKAGPVNLPDSINFGHNIQNSRDNILNGKIDLVKFYNKVKFLKDINSPSRTQGRRSSTLPQQQQQDTTKANKPEFKGFKKLLRTLMAVRNINGTYTRNEGTLLAGFIHTPSFFGLDSTFNIPGAPFVLGNQDPDIRFHALNNNWLVSNNRLTTPFTQVKNIDLSLRASVEPLNDFKIQLTAKKTKNASYKELFRDTIPGSDIGFASLNPSRTGTYSITFISLATAFSKDDADNNSPVFAEFEKNLELIKNRLSTATGLSYEQRNQDIMIPAFVAAYSGVDAEQVSLTPFPKIPLPNWRVDYNGLSKIPELREVFQSITLRHSYQSKYSIMNFTNSLEYNNLDGIGLDNKIENYNIDQFAYKPNEAGEIIPVYIINQVIITEQFAPLFGISVRTTKRLTAMFEYNKKRDVSLNLSNTQVTELNSNDVSLEMGYTKDKFTFPFKMQGRTITLDNDLTFRLNFTIRNTETIQRKIDEGSTITNGNINFQLRPTVSYVVNEKLNLQFYFDRSINEPKVSTSYRRATTRFGVQVRFSLAQ
ncbi:MAG: cell surface protein SprA, partial [Cyclobacteriaceae bacterium]|nr:cell surface protein SprA [Cyclobacteriaceae bacterium]